MLLEADPGALIDELLVLLEREGVPKIDLRGEENEKGEAGEGEGDDDDDENEESEPDWAGTWLISWSKEKKTAEGGVFSRRRMVLDS